MHTVDQKTFDLFCARAKRMYKVAPNTIDERILGLVNALNRVPGLVTTWSCSGHTAKEFADRKNDHSGARIGSRRWYVTFVMLGDNSEFIDMLSDLFVDMSSQTICSIRPKLEMIALSSRTVDGEYWYKSWSFEGNFYGTDDYIELLSDYWNEVIRRIDNYVGRVNE